MSSLYFFVSQKYSAGELHRSDLIMKELVLTDVEVELWGRLHLFYLSPECRVFFCFSTKPSPWGWYLNPGWLTAAFQCIKSLLHLVTVLSRGTLWTSRAWKTNRTLNAVTTCGTHGTFLSLNIQNKDVLQQSSQCFFLKKCLIEKVRVGQKYSQDLLSLQQGRGPLGDRCVPSDQWDHQGQQNLSLQENPVATDQRQISRCCIMFFANEWSTFPAENVWNN